MDRLGLFTLGVLVDAIAAQGVARNNRTRNVGTGLRVLAEAEA